MDGGAALGGVGKSQSEVGLGRDAGPRNWSQGTDRLPLACRLRPVSNSESLCAGSPAGWEDLLQRAAE
jgi:hypothetical protein